MKEKNTINYFDDFLYFKIYMYRAVVTTNYNFLVSTQKLKTSKHFKGHCTFKFYYPK